MDMVFFDKSSAQHLFLPPVKLLKTTWIINKAILAFIFGIPAIKPLFPVYNNMEMEIQKKSVDSFFRKEYKKLVSFVRMNLDDRYYDASPEDIVQDVVLGLVSRLNPDTQIANLTAYVYRSLRNRITDFRRKKQQTVSMESFTNSKNENYLLNSVADETNADELDYNDIEPETLRQALLQLRPDEQAVIMATEFKQRTYEELSEEWDIPVGTLLSRKHRALSKLYKMLIINK